MADIGQKLRFGPVGGFGAGLFVVIALCELAELPRLDFKLPAALLVTLESRPHLLLPFEEAVLAQLRHSYVGAYAHHRTVAGPILTDLQPSPVCQSLFAKLKAARNDRGIGRALRNRFLRLRLQVLEWSFGQSGAGGDPVELAKFTVAELQPLLIIPDRD